MEPLKGLLVVKSAFIEHKGAQHHLITVRTSYISVASNGIESAQSGPDKMGSVPQPAHQGIEVKGFSWIFGGLLHRICVKTVGN